MLLRFFVNISLNIIIFPLWVPTGCGIHMRRTDMKCELRTISVRGVAPTVSLAPSSFHFSCLTQHPLQLLKAAFTSAALRSWWRLSCSMVSPCWPRVPLCSAFRGARDGPVRPPVPGSPRGATQQLSLKVIVCICSKTCF